MQLEGHGRVVPVLVPWDPLPRLQLQHPRGSALQQVLCDRGQSQACASETLHPLEVPLGTDDQTAELCLKTSEIFRPVKMYQHCCLG